MNCFKHSKISKMLTKDTPVLSYHSSASDPPRVPTALRVKTSVDHHPPVDQASIFQRVLSSPLVISVSATALPSLCVHDVTPCWNLSAPAHQTQCIWGHFVQCHSLKKASSFLEAPPCNTLIAHYFFFFKIFYIPF